MPRWTHLDSRTNCRYPISKPILCRPRHPLLLLLLPFLVQLFILAPALLGRAVGPLLPDGADDARATLGPILQVIQALGENIPRVLAVLRARARRLRLDDDAGRYVFELHGRVGFVNFLTAGPAAFEVRLFKVAIGRVSGTRGHRALQGECCAAERLMRGREGRGEEARAAQKTQHGEIGDAGVVDGAN